MEGSERQNMILSQWEIIFVMSFPFQNIVVYYNLDSNLKMDIGELEKNMLAIESEEGFFC